VRLIALILAGSLSGASTDERAIGMLRDWIAAVERHRAGEPDAPLSGITDWTYGDVELMRPYVEALIEAPVRNNRDRQRRSTLLDRDDVAQIREITKDLKLRGNFDLFRRRAAILHTDAALLGAPPEVVAPAPAQNAQRPRWAREQSQRRINVRTFDGRFEGFEYANLHWELAMDTLDALPASPRDPFVGEWYAAIGTHFVQRRQQADALVHFARARLLVPDDPRVLFSEARLHAALGSSRVQNFVRLTMLGNGLSVRGVASARDELRRAETLLQRALAGDPAMVAARLRLGHTVMQQGRLEEGLQLVHEARSATADRTLSYYANLFAGDAELALGRIDDAKQSFERALALYPDAQSPRLGLSAAIGAGGEREHAVAAILPTLIKRPDGRADDDPWWMYYDANLAEADAALEQLRAPFTEPLR
jgi:tetratricopeptide (TPR) repeat protein